MVANVVLNDTSNNSIARTLAENRNNDTPADFDKAIAATGFGTYNIVLLLAAIPAGWASAFDMTTAAFFLSSAECDLELTFIRNGALVSFVYIGMIVSSFFWGFVTDNANRKPLILLGLLADACCNILSSVIDSYYVFLLIKFLTGTIISGPFSLLVPYLAEFQSVTHRATFVSWTGFIFAIGNVIPAVLAFAILPLPWSVTVFDRVFVSWRMYILVCSIPSILGILTISFLPESPKRLMAIGKSDRALELMKRMYSINTREPADTFPIRVLIEETKLNYKSRTNYERIRESWNNFKILLGRPHRSQFFITTFLQFGGMLGFNTMRLWLPHMFTIMNNFDYTLWDSSWAKPTLCEMLVPGVVPPGLDDPDVYANNTGTYIQWRIESFIYMNSTIIATSAVGFSFFIVMFLDTRITKKVVLLASFLIGTMCTFAANWGQAVPIMLIFCSTTIATSRIASNIVIAVSDNVIPARLRVTAASFVTIIGSLGTVVGNLIFSTLLDTDCIAAFIWLGCSLLLCAIVSLFALKPPPKSADIELSEEPKMVARF